LVQDSTVGKAAGILSMSMGELGYTRTFTNVTKRLQ
jgi:hypothetical protein